jgi:hypothetical protein
MMFALACGGVPSHPPVETSGASAPGQSASGSNGGASSGDAGVLPLSYAVSGAISDGLNVTQSGAEICVLGLPSVCTTTDSSGGYQLAGVPATGSGITGTTPGGVTTIWPLTLEGNASNDGIIRPTTIVDNYAAEAHASFGTSTGAIEFAVLDGAGNGYPGIGLTSTSGGTTAYFTSTGSDLDATLTSTTVDGGGYIFGLPPGTASLSLMGTSGASCRPAGGDGWLPNTTGEIPAPVQVGSVTVVRIVCGA